MDPVVRQGCHGVAGCKEFFLIQTSTRVSMKISHFLGYFWKGPTKHCYGYLVRYSTNRKVKFLLRYSTKVKFLLRYDTVRDKLFSLILVYGTVRYGTTYFPNITVRYGTDASACGTVRYGDGIFFTVRYGIRSPLGESVIVGSPSTPLPGTHPATVFSEIISVIILKFDFLISKPLTFSV